jgi:hypothetical protein
MHLLWDLPALSWQQPVRKWRRSGRCWEGCPMEWYCCSQPGRGRTFPRIQPTAFAIYCGCLWCRAALAQPLHLHIKVTFQSPFYSASFTHSLTHSLTHSITHLLNHSLSNPTHPPTFPAWLTHSPTHPPIHFPCLAALWMDCRNGLGVVAKEIITGSIACSHSTILTEYVDPFYISK